MIPSLTLAATIALSPGSALSPDDVPPPVETRADAATILAGQLDRTAHAMRAELARRDHEVLLGRKRSVDWALAPAFLLADITEGLSPSAWGASLDDGYRGAAPIAPSTHAMPPEVAAWCQWLAASEGGIEFAYLAEVTEGTSAEVPVAIHWSGTLGLGAAALRSDWYEPCLALRGVDFPLLPDRTVVAWDDDGMRVNVWAGGGPWEAPWPTDPPSFAHVADEYDLFAGLRAWHWSRLDARPSDECQRKAEWSPLPQGGWRLTLSLRESVTPRSAGFVLEVAQRTMSLSAEQSHERAITADVCTVGPGTELTVEFGRSEQADLCEPTRMSLTVGGSTVAWAEFERIERAGASSIQDPWALPPSGRWTDAMLRVRVAQESPRPPALFPPDLIRRDPDLGSQRATVVANVWSAAMAGNLAELSVAIAQGESLRADAGLSRHDLAALATLAESLHAQRAPSASIDWVMTRHRARAAQLNQDQLQSECLRAAAESRFWAAAQFASLARDRQVPGSGIRSRWDQACALLDHWKHDPANEIAIGTDPISVALTGAVAGIRDLDPALERSEGGRAAPHAFSMLRDLLADDWPTPSDPPI